jgi:hypothetical protein
MQRWVGGWCHVGNIQTVESTVIMGQCFNPGGWMVPLAALMLVPADLEGLDGVCLPMRCASTLPACRILARQVCAISWQLCWIRAQS